MFNTRERVCVCVCLGGGVGALKQSLHREILNQEEFSCSQKMTDLKFQTPERTYISDQISTSN